MVYHEGYRPIRQQLYMNPGATQRIKGEMEPLPQGEINEPRPQPAQAPPEQQAQPAQGLPDEPYWILDPQSPGPARKARDAGPRRRRLTPASGRWRFASSPQVPP